MKKKKGRKEGSEGGRKEGRREGNTNSGSLVDLPALFFSFSKQNDKHSKWS